jgi:alpha-mannosidase
LLVSFKIADDDVGYVVRLLEFSGKPTRADIRFGPLAVSKVVPADASEQEQPVKEGDAGSVKDGAIIVKFRPYELKTLRVIFKE